jgi:hypothetical protein
MNGPALFATDFGAAFVGALLGAAIGALVYGVVRGIQAIGRWLRGPKCNEPPDSEPEQIPD